MAIVLERKTRLNDRLSGKKRFNGANPMFEGWITLAVLKTSENKVEIQLGN